MATTTGRKKGWQDRDPRTKYHGSTLGGPGRGAGTEFQSRPWGGDKGNTHGQQKGERAPGMKGDRMASPASKRAELFEARGHTDYGTRGRLMNCVEAGGEYDPLPVSYHRNGGTSGAGHKFKGVRGY